MTIAVEAHLLKRQDYLTLCPNSPKSSPPIKTTTGQKEHSITESNPEASCTPATLTYSYPQRPVQSHHRGTNPSHPLSSRKKRAIIMLMTPKSITYGSPGKAHPKRPPVIQPTYQMMHNQFTHNLKRDSVLRKALGASPAKI